MARRKIDERQIRQIVEMVEEGKLTRTEIARKFGIDPATVSRIWHGQYRPDVTGRSGGDKSISAHRREVSRRNAMYLWRKGVPIGDILEMVGVSDSTFRSYFREEMGQDYVSPRSIRRMERDAAIWARRVRDEALLADIAEEFDLSLDGVRNAIRRWESRGKRQACQVPLGLSRRLPLAVGAGAQS